MVTKIFWSKTQLRFEHENENYGVQTSRIMVHGLCTDHRIISYLRIYITPLTAEIFRGALSVKVLQKQEGLQAMRKRPIVGVCYGLWGRSFHKEGPRTAKPRCWAKAVSVWELRDQDDLEERAERGLCIKSQKYLGARPCCALETISRTLSLTQEETGS